MHINIIGHLIQCSVGWSGSWLNHNRTGVILTLVLGGVSFTTLELEDSAVNWGENNFIIIMSNLTMVLASCTTFERFALGLEQGVDSTTLGYLGGGSVVVGASADLLLPGLTEVYRKYLHNRFSPLPKTTRWRAKKRYAYTTYALY